MVKLTCRPFMVEEDLPFFEKLASESVKWRKNELNGENLREYIKKYEGFPGEWRIWELSGRAAAISYHTGSAPSNQKPWLGTMIVSAGERRKGVASAVISHLSSEFKEKGQKVIFAGVPMDEYEWSNFLSDCGFEQFKAEEEGEETFLIMVRPLD